MLALFTGLALGLAELTKMTWILLFALWPLLWLVWRAPEGRPAVAPGLAGPGGDSNWGRFCCPPFM